MIKVDFGEKEHKLKEYIKDFLFHCKYEKNLSSKTLAAYEIDLRQFFVFCNNTICITDIQNVNKYILKRYLKTISSKFKPKTLKRKLASLRAFFNHLQFEDVIEINPFSKVKIRIKEGNRVPRTIDPKIIKQLYKYLYGQKNKLKIGSKAYIAIVRDIAVLELLFSTGLRVSELSNLKISSMDLNNALLRINGKGNKERLIPISNTDAKNALRCYLTIYRKQVIKADYLFLNRFNRRLSEQSIRFMIKKYMKRLNIDSNITPHMFRHSLATMLLENEVDLRYIQDLLGHSSINTTQIYLTINKSKQQKILSRKHPRNNLC